MNLEQLKLKIAKKFSLGLSTRVDLYDLLSLFLTTGQSTNYAISELWTDADRRKEMIAVVFKDWLNQLKVGTDFSTAIAGDIPGNELAIIRAGESKGEPELGFEAAKKMAINSARLRKVFFRLTYPLIMLTVGILFLYVSTTQLLPMLRGVLPLEQWPTGARMYNSFGTFMSDHGMLLSVVAGGFAFGSLWSLRYNFPGRKVLDHYLPPWNINRIFYSSSFLITIGMMLKSGKSTKETIAMLTAKANPWFNHQLSLMLDLLNKGERTGYALNTGRYGLLDQRETFLVNAYEKANALEGSMEKISEKSLERAIGQINTIVVLTGSLFLLLTGGIIAWYLLSLFDVINVFNQQLNSSGI